MIEQARRLMQDTSGVHHTDAEIITLIGTLRARLFPGVTLFSDEQDEALVILAAFRLLQARDAAMILEGMATVQG